MPKPVRKSEPVKVIKSKKEKVASPKPKAKKKPKKSPVVATPPPLTERLEKLRLQKLEAKNKIEYKPKPRTLDKLPEGLVQAPFKRVKPGHVFFHRKVELLKLSDIPSTIKVGKKLFNHTIEETVKGVSHFGLAKAKDEDFKFQFNEYENVLTDPAVSTEWLGHLRELRELRELFFTLTWREIMARYLETAETANEFIKTTVEEYKKGANRTELQIKAFAILLGTIYNLGIRSNPRPAQSTVRHRAVQQALMGLPVRVEMKKQKDEKTGVEFNHLELS